MRGSLTLVNEAYEPARRSGAPRFPIQNRVQGPASADVPAPARGVRRAGRQYQRLRDRSRQPVSRASSPERDPHAGTERKHAEPSGGNRASRHVANARLRLRRHAHPLDQGRHPTRDKSGKLSIKTAELLKHCRRAEVVAGARAGSDSELAFCGGLLFDALAAVGREVFGEPKGFTARLDAIFTQGRRAAQFGQALARS